MYLFILMKKGAKKKRKKTVLRLNSDFNILKKVLKISIPLTVSAAIGSLVNLLDVGLVMRTLRKTGFSELQANIIYGNYTTLAVPMFNLVATLLAPVSAVLLPLLAKNASHGNSIEFQKKTKLSLDISLFITVPIAFLFFGFSESILTFIFEDDSAKMAAPLLSALSFSTVFMGMLLVINTAIEGEGNYRVKA
jgi:stage V sporulation protein B